MQLTIRELRRKFQAVDALSHRALPGRDTELKVATLLRMYLGKPYQLAEDRINQALADHPVPDDHDGEALPARIRDLRGMATEEVQRLTIEIKDIPDHLKIKKGDLPKESKHLEQNQIGVANIIASLGDDLYADFGEDQEDDFEPKIL